MAWDGINDWLLPNELTGKTGVCLCVVSRFSCVQLSVTLWTVACQASLSTGFPRQEDWSGLPFPSAGDLPDPGIEPTSLMSSALAGGCSAGDPSLILGLARPLGEGKGYPLQCSGLENFMDYIVHGVAKSRTLHSLPLAPPEKPQ